jgi:hypothetical protein
MSLRRCIPTTASSMYPFVLGLHNLIRWVVLLAGAWAILLAWRGWLGRGSWTVTESRAVKIFVGTLDLQLTVGLLLYFVFSPLTRGAFSDFGAAMRDAPMRYFVVEHLVIMIVAIAVAHVGAGRVKKATTDPERFQRASIWLGIAFAAVAGFVPWARPLIPSF